MTTRTSKSIVVPVVPAVLLMMDTDSFGSTKDTAIEQQHGKEKKSLQTMHYAEKQWITASERVDKQGGNNGKKREGEGRRKKGWS